MTPPRLRWVIYFAAITFMMAVMLTSFYKEFERVNRLSVALEKRMDVLINEERRHQELKDKIALYSTQEGIARLARERYQMVKSGEVLYDIKAPSVDKQSISTEE